MISEPIIFDYLLVKLAARCNIACTYCYWFRDNTVYSKPKILSTEAEKAFLQKLKRHIENYKLKNFFVLFHGGEPMLFGKQRFTGFCSQLRLLESELDFKLRLAITTNGLLIDSEWANLFKRFQVGVTISLDGPAAINDQSRVDFQGKGVFNRVMNAIKILREIEIEPGVLAVCNPTTNPEEVCRFFVEELDISAFDILVPDATHEDTPKSIEDYYIKLFDVWYKYYIERGVRIRYLETLIQGLLGGESHVESIGYGPNTTCTLLTDGSLEPLDVLRTAGDGFTQTQYNILTHELQDVQQDPLWQEVLKSSLSLAPVCQSCEFKLACGGGHIGSRWSDANRYNNPSVYCNDIKGILTHVWKTVSQDVILKTAEGKNLYLSEAIQSVI